MIQYLKKAVSKIIPVGQTELYNAVVCIMICDINSGCIGEQFNLISHVKDTKRALIEYSKHKDFELSEFTPLDYAEYYGTVGNSILFLRTYQDNFGPIE